MERNVDVNQDDSFVDLQILIKYYFLYELFVYIRFDERNRIFTRNYTASSKDSHSVRNT